MLSYVGWKSFQWQERMHDEQYLRGNAESGQEHDRFYSQMSSLMTYCATVDRLLDLSRLWFPYL